jgi:osmotically-inducible protein OsmY
MNFASTPLQGSFHCQEKLMQRIVSLACSVALAFGLAGCGPEPANQQQAANPEKSTKSEQDFRSAVTPAPTPDRVAANAELGQKVKWALSTPTPDAPAPINGQIEAIATDGVVQLFGTVNAASEKERAALLALGVEGVRSVVNNIEVTEPRTS